MRHFFKLPAVLAGLLCLSLPAFAQDGKTGLGAEP